jgi:AcrR family transcriptional regulator
MANSARLAMTLPQLRDIERMIDIATAQESLGMGLTATKPRPAAPRRGVPKSRGGRPTKTAAIERDQRLIEVATRLFLDRGFEATSLDAVAQAARVSKPTVYSRYGDKRGLFAAVLRREIARWLAPLSAAAEMQLSSASDISVEQRLVEIGREMLTFTCGPDAVAFSRMMTSQAINFPDVAKLGKEEGWLKAVATTARFFDHLVAKGALDVEDTTIAAEVFLDVVVGHTHRMATFGTALELKPAEKRMRVAIKLFLAGALGPADRVQDASKVTPRRPSR